VSAPPDTGPERWPGLPTSGERPPGELEALERHWRRPAGAWGWITAINNNIIGVYFLGAAMLFFVLAGVLALLMRTQLALPMGGFLPQETYNQLFTMHGTVMMFLFAVPAVEALGVLLLPQMLGARDLPFPRLGAFAFWSYLVGGLSFFASLFFGLAPNGGWFMYPPLTSMTYSPGLNADFWLLGIGFIEISAIAGAIEIVVGVLRTRAPGMGLDKLPIFAWGMLIFAVMILVAFPSVILATLLLELERAFGWPFFDSALGGDPVLWQHLFWFFGHPEVYIIFLPAAAAMSTLIPAMARTPLVGYRLVVLAMIATGFISFGVWSHHMFTTGMPVMSVSVFSAASMAVSVPAGVQVFAWIATFAAGRPRLNTPTLFALGALVIFVMGGLTGVMVAMVPFDWQAHDSYFIVAHLHYVLIGGMVFPLFASIYYWLPMSSARPLSERLGRWVFGLMFTGMHVTFLPMHLTGLMGMPRRVYTYLPDRGWELPNLISTVGAFLFAAGVLLWIIDMARNFRPFGAPEAGNVYGGPGLEWIPTGDYSIRSIPVVRSREPLWDQPELSEQVQAGRWFLPGVLTASRETLVTSSVEAIPRQLMRLPGPGPWQVWAGLLTAAFFLLLVVKAYVLAALSGVGAIYCMLHWAWTLDHPGALSRVEVGPGVWVPTYARGPAGHGWWAAALTLGVGAMVTLLTAFAHIFLWSRRPDLWAPPPELAWLGLLLLLAVAAGLLAWLSVRLLDQARPRASVAVMALAGALLVAAWGVDAGSWWLAGLRPDASPQGATVFALLTWQGGFVLASALMTLYALARAAAGLWTPSRPATAEIIALFIAFTAAQGALPALLTRLFPGG
jgi:cytochrome c oxidase subunit I+III